MPSFAVIVIAYNRLFSVQRLVSSLLKADYFGDEIDLIISIDHSGAGEIEEFARNIAWPHGKLRIIAHSSRLGLKRHVLSCGDLTAEYEYTCVLEDDLIVSPGYYSFCKQVIIKYDSEPLIAGVSLYSHQWNPYTDGPFWPVEDGADVYLLQVASSWGQIWNRRWWGSFRAWLEGKSDADVWSADLPESVAQWSTNSWLKFYNRFLTASSRFFVYPRQSLTTNFSEPGTHAKGTATYQVPLLHGIQRAYRFPMRISDTVMYDAFFENIKLARQLDVAEASLDVSLYGNRPRTKRYLLTMKRHRWRVVRSFGLRLRPADMNVLLSIPGDDIFLYDSYHQASLPRRDTYLDNLAIDIRMSSLRKLWAVTAYLTLRRLRQLLARWTS